MTESNEISIHQARAFRALQRSADRWMTARELAEKAKVAPRSARAFAKRFVDNGVADQAEVFPGHRYRLSPMAAKRNTGYLKRLEEACVVFGV